MSYNLLPEVAAQLEQDVRNELTSEINTLRATLEMCDREIAAYEADIAASNQQSAQMLIEVQALTANLRNWPNEFAKYEENASKLARIVAKNENDLNKCRSALATITKSFGNTHVSTDKSRTQIQSQIVRYNDLRAAIEKRKKWMQDIGYEHRERLEHPLDMARTRATELQSKQERS